MENKNEIEIEITNAIYHECVKSGRVVETVIYIMHT